MFRLRSQLDSVERATFKRHAWAAFFDASFMAMCWSGAEIVVKGFHGGVLAVTLITMAPGAAQLLSLGMGRPMAAIGRRRLLRISAWVGRLPLVLVIFVSGPYTFVALITVQAISQVAVTTVWNSLLRTNYRVEHRGALYSMAQVGGALMGGITTVGAGLWLDHDQVALRYIYPLVTVAGIAACLIFAEIDVRRSLDGEEEEQGPHESFRELIRTFVRDRAFLRYEIAFFLYGLAFMTIMTAKPIRTADQLAFSYSVLLGAKGVFAVCMAFSTVFMGRMMDRVGPAGLAGRCFSFLGLYAVVLLAMTEPWLFFVAEALFGLAMGGVHIAWNMGPVTMAPTAAAAASYMQIHVALVGLRAFIGHSLGGWIVHLTGEPRWVFLLGVVLFAAATVMMLRLASHDVGERARDRLPDEGRRPFSGAR